MPEIIDRIKEDLSFEKVLAQAVKVPGVNIDREEFLRKELQRFCSEDALEIAVRSNPAKAGISRETIDKISKSVIDYESTKVTALSVAASLPSSANALAAVGAAGVDIVSYFSFVLRVVQELAYLYGFEEFELNDSGTMHAVLLFIGTMYQVQGATSSLSKLASKMAENVAKNLAKKSLTKGTIYPIVREIAKKVGVRMTKQIFADTIASGIPIAGSLLSGGLTYVCFKPYCMRLRKQLMEFNLCDPGYYNAIYI